MHTAPEDRANTVPGRVSHHSYAQQAGANSNGFILRVAQRLEIALDAFGLARMAHTPPVPDYLVGEQNPLFARKDMYQILLHFFRVSVFCQVEPPRYSKHVSIDNHA